MEVEMLLVVLGVVAALLVLDIASLRLGVDSRPGMGDDHRR